MTAIPSSHKNSVAIGEIATFSTQFRGHRMFILPRSQPFAPMLQITRITAAHESHGKMNDTCVGGHRSCETHALL